MFRKIAVALVAASVFAAPVLAQTKDNLSGGTATNPSNETEKANKPEKTEKSAESTEKTEKTVTHHHHAARHHRSKAAKAGKARTATAMYGKTLSHKTPGGKTSKFARTETRRVGHGKLLPKRAYGKAYRHSPSGMTTH
jgi:hypothetical protein